MKLVIARLMERPSPEPHPPTHYGNDPYRPQLISRHSSCLPMTHLIKKKTSKLFSRRCRSASPPIKKKTITAILSTDSDSSGSQFSSIEEICHKLQRKELHGGIAQRPIIKQLTSSFAVKQPKAMRMTQVSCSRIQVLNDHKHSLSISSVLDRISSKQLSKFESATAHVLSPADINGNHVRPASLPSVRRDSISKPRKVKTYHSKSFSQPDEAFDENLSLWLEEKLEPARKRRSSYCSVSPLKQISAFDQQLPVECRLKIFSYLGHHDKGKCMLVSKSWYELIRQPLLWQDIDFRDFKLCYKHDKAQCSVAASQENTVYPTEHLERDDFSDNSHDFIESHLKGCSVSVYTQCSQDCYNQYMSRIDSFISFLIDLKPSVKRLSFSFDVISDNWLARLERFVLCVNLKELEYADLNWRDTPVKPFSLGQNEQGLNDMLYKTRRRQRSFMSFMELFVQEAPNVVTLILPFYWSPRSTNYLISLKKLRNLTLEKYFVFQRLNQEHLNAISKIKHLERLVLEVWNPSSSDTSTYNIKSKTLRYLDLSQCRGFFINSLDLPSLEVFVTERKPWNGTLTFTNQLDLRCLQDILSNDTPRLCRINQQPVTYNSLVSDVEISAIFKRLCPCKQHKGGLIM